jgi:hypothetical protein
MSGPAREMEFACANWIKHSFGICVLMPMR